jgi:hypothetical protein
MAKRYSEDLRTRVVETIDAGPTIPEAAEQCRGQHKLGRALPQASPRHGQRQCGQIWWCRHGCLATPQPRPRRPCASSARAALRSTSVSGEVRLARRHVGSTDHSRIRSDHLHAAHRRRQHIVRLADALGWLADCCRTIDQERVVRHDVIQHAGEEARIP